MTKAEKYAAMAANNEAIAANVPKVYAAGQKSMVDESKLVPTTVSGSYISVDDVSEVPHNVACKISGVDNPEAVKVTRTGANLLFNKRGNVSKGGITWTVNDDGTLNINGTIGTTGTGNYDYYFFGKNGENEDAFTLPCDAILSTNKAFLDSNNVVSTRTSTGPKTINGLSPNKSVVIPAGTRIYGVWVRIYNTTIDEKGVYVSLNLGTTALPYEPYNGQILTPAADGTVEGMTSVSPCMNIYTDTEGVNIEATYNKSWGMQTEYDRFWDNFNATNLNCAYAGTYWSKHTFKPNHDIIIPEGKQATQLFFYHGWWNSPYDLDAQLKACGVVLDFSKSTGFSETFRYACFTKLPEISTVSASSLQGMFNGMQWLKEIVRLVLKDDGSQTFTSQYSGKTFENCSSLTSITIAGVIGQDISFQWCPLTKASITNIINTLSSTATGQTLTLKLSAVNTAFETSVGAGDGSTSAEFAALVATKTNWTITMI